VTTPWLGGALMAVLLSVTPALAQKTVVGVTDTEIKIGQSAAFSGPASVYGQISTAESDYFKMINEQGGISGRKINLIAVDDGYSPPKTIEVVRRLIEDEQVAILFQTIGTAPNAAIRKYYNQKKVPDIWLGSGASMFVTDPKEYPWSIPFQPSYRLEGQMYAKYILAKKPTAKIAILYQNDDLGRCLMRLPTRRSTRRSCSCRLRGRICSMTRARRNSPPWRSARLLTSTGTRCISSIPTAPW
jgi:branched-chain amino acid transport system substrate-binding protein